MRRNQGFTLIEMLISMVLLTMVLLIASGAYSLFSERWHGRLGYFNQSATQAKQLILVQEVLKSIIPYVVTDEQGNANLYFEGNRNGFVAVARRSLFNPESSAVVRLKVRQNEDFSYALVYQEWAMTKQLLTKVRQQIDFSEDIVLFDNLKTIEFLYFGWPSTKSKYWQPDVSRELPEPKGWFSEYDSIQKKIHPEQVKVNFSNAQGDFILQTELSAPMRGVLNRYGKVE